MKPSGHREHYTKSTVDSQSEAGHYHLIIITGEIALYNLVKATAKRLSSEHFKVVTHYAATPADARATLARHPETSLAFMDSKDFSKKRALIQWTRNLSCPPADIHIALLTEASDPILENNVLETLQINDCLFRGKALSDRLTLVIKRDIQRFLLQKALYQEEKKREIISHLLHAHRLEAIGTLAGGIAHDFNNILGGISGYAQLIQFELDKTHTAVAHAKQIINGCQRAKDLTLKILDFSMQSESACPYRMAEVAPIVNQTVQLLREATPRSIQIQVDTENDPGWICADASQIHQALMNLCTNARQAIRTDTGKIHIRMGTTTLPSKNFNVILQSSTCHGCYTYISVTDTGEGIGKDTIDKIFNPYFTTKKRGDGRGLGLSVVHGIVIRFNGGIDFKTSPGNGSTFTLFFPSKKKDRPPQKNVH